LKSFAALVASVAVAGVIATAAPAFARGAPESFADLADKLSPAVVNISTTQYVDRKKTDDAAPGGNVPWDQWFRDYLDKRDGSGNDNRTQRRRQTSLGSGFIIDKAGYVVTNNHVIEDADQISVILEDDTVLEAKVVGRDEKVDIALLKIEAKKDLPFVAWGNSGQVRVGDWVLAIGNPFGLSGTVTAGIVSARARDIKSGQYDDYIQTDAAINRGNSGGPLFNMDGAVIGVNTAIFSPSGGSVGVGFASSANLVRPVIEDLRKYGRTRRGWIGVQVQSVSEEIALSLGLDKARGALVSQVTDGGPATSSGIESSDVILSFDGKPIDKMNELPKVVAQTAIDKAVDVQLWRKGQQKMVKLKVAELKDVNEKVVASAKPPTASRQEVKKTELKDLGVSVIEISEDARQKYQIPESVHGLVVASVDEFSDAALKGLRPGDVIDEIQQARIGNVADADAAIHRARDSARKVVLLRIMTAGGIRYVPVKMVG
jgi:serine protease Do